MVRWPLSCIRRVLISHVRIHDRRSGISGRGYRIRRVWRWRWTHIHGKVYIYVCISRVTAS